MTQKEICNGCGKPRMIDNQTYHLCRKCNQDRLQKNGFKDLFRGKSIAEINRLKSSLPGSSIQPNGNSSSSSSKTDRDTLRVPVVLPSSVLPTSEEKGLEVISGKLDFVDEKGEDFTEREKLIRRIVNEELSKNNPKDQIADIVKACVVALRKADIEDKKSAITFSCPYCGVPVVINQSYCSQCGEKIEWREVE
jgi:hypothetical protein